MGRNLSRSLPAATACLRQTAGPRLLTSVTLFLSVFLHSHLGVSHCGGGRAGCALCMNAPIMLSLLCLLSVFMRPCHELLLSGRYRVSVFVSFMTLCSDNLFMHCVMPRVCVSQKFRCSFCLSFLATVRADCCRYCLLSL